jgi:hypothetical protein
MDRDQAGPEQHPADHPESRTRKEGKHEHLFVNPLCECAPSNLLNLINLSNLSNPTNPQTQCRCGLLGLRGFAVSAGLLGFSVLEGRRTFWKTGAGLDQPGRTDTTSRPCNILGSSEWSMTGHSR